MALPTARSGTTPYATRAIGYATGAVGGRATQQPPDPLGQLARAPERKGRMNIVMRDGRVFRGTAVQIVKAMQDIAFGVEQFTLPEYIDWVVQNAAKFEEVELKITGETDEENATSLVAEMIRTGLTRKM